LTAPIVKTDPPAGISLAWLALDQNSLITAAPNRLYAQDVTYIKLRHEFIYLAVIMDVFTRDIRGWQLDVELETGLALGALEKVLLRGTAQIHLRIKACNMRRAHTRL
jgi:transposase InsO family protein